MQVPYYHETWLSKDVAKYMQYIPRHITHKKKFSDVFCNNYFSKSQQQLKFRHDCVASFAWLTTDSLCYSVPILDYIWKGSQCHLAISWGNWKYFGKLVHISFVNRLLIFRISPKYLQIFGKLNNLSNLCQPP